MLMLIISQISLSFNNATAEQAEGKFCHYLNTELIKTLTLLCFVL